MNAKVINHACRIIIITFFCIGFGFFWAGCRSQPNVAGSDILQSAENIGRLQEQNRQITSIVDEFAAGIDSIENRISNIERGIESAQEDAHGAGLDIDRAIQLFIEYKSRVDKFFDDYRNLQEQIKNSQ